MTSTTINQYINNYAKGKESDYEIECSRNQYGVIRIVLRSKYLTCDVPKCRTIVKRKMLKEKRWTDHQGFNRTARLCPTCDAVAKDLYNI